MKQSCDVLTIGLATLDVFLGVDLPIIEDDKKNQMIALPFGEKIDANKIHFSVGGNALNAAITFKRQGLKVASKVSLGNDVVSKIILEKLKQEKIGIDLIDFVVKKHTSFSALLLNRDDRTIINYKDAGEELVLNNLENLFKAKWWYLSLPGKSMKSFSKLVHFADKNKIKIAFNPTGMHIVRDKKSIMRNLSKIDFLVLNDKEAVELTEKNNTKEAFLFLKKNLKGILAVTMGKNGALITDGERDYEVSNFKEKRMVDRTGAGDAFGSGFVAGLIKKKEECVRGKIDKDNILYAIRLASANATSVVEHIGANDGALSEKDFLHPRFTKLKINILK